MVDKYTYTYTFLITAFIQGFAVLIWVLLLAIVPTKEHASKASPSSSPGSEPGPAKSGDDGEVGGMPVFFKVERVERDGGSMPVAMHPADGRHASAGDERARSVSGWAETGEERARSLDH